MIDIKLRDPEIDKFEYQIRKADGSVHGVLISHLYFESYIDRYLKTKFINSGVITSSRGFSFSNKLKIVQAFGELEPQIFDALKKLNEIRNNCAHVLDHEISKKEVESFGRTLGKDYKKLIEQYPKAGLHGIAPITWHIAGRLLYFVMKAEGKVET